MFVFFFFKQKTAYDMRISDWSSDVCSSDLPDRADRRVAEHRAGNVAIIHHGRLVAEHGVGKRLSLADRDRSQLDPVGHVADREDARRRRLIPLVDRKSTRLNSSH